MRSRWLLNLALLLVVGAIVLFLYLRPEKKAETGLAQYPVSSVKATDIARISIEFPAKAPVVLEKRDGNWFLTQPYAARAGQAMVDHLLSILAVTSSEKFPANDPGRFALDHPELKLRLGGEEFVFGTHNPLDGRQYVAYKDAVYLLPAHYAEAASTQVVEMIDKNLLAPGEQVAGFDFSRLEQWQPTGLKLDMENGKWKVAISAAAKPDQNELNEWFDSNWKSLDAVSVEPYKPDPRASYPSFLVKLKNGKTIRFDKLHESPELQLGRPDEGMLYHLSQDTGFVILNPPIGYKPK